MSTLIMTILFTLMVASWLAWAGFIALTPPEALINRLFFFALLFTAVFSGSVLAAYWLSFRLFLLKRHQGDLRRALLQGASLACLALIAAWLQSLRVLTWGMAAILLGIVGVLEYLLLPRRAR